MKLVPQVPPITQTLRQQGLCGALHAYTACVMVAGHDGPCGWEPAHDNTTAGRLFCRTFGCPSYGSWVERVPSGAASYCESCKKPMCF